MFVLTRHLNQTITVGGYADDNALIEVTVVEVRGDQVRIGTARRVCRPQGNLDSQAAGSDWWMTEMYTDE